MKATLRAAIAALLLVAMPMGALAQHGEHGEAAHGDEGSHGEASHEEGAHGEHGEAHEEGAHGEHGHATFESIDWFEMGGSVFNFAIWLFLIGFALSRGLPPFLRNRRAAIVDGMEDARRVKEEAEAKHKEYSERIENLDAELDRIREEMKQAGMAERDKIVEDASKKAERLRADARFLIEQQMKQLREDLTREAVEAAIAAATEILTKSTTAADQERLAREYLDSVVAQVGASKTSSTAPGSRS